MHSDICFPSPISGSRGGARGSIGVRPVRTLSRLRTLAGRLGLLLACLAAQVGCQSPAASGSDALVSMTIVSPHSTRVRLAVVKVFEAEHFEGKSVFDPEMVFERRGSLGDSLLRGGLLSGKTIERVRVRVTPVGPETCQVDCRAFTVQYPGDRVMEEEFRIRRKGPYRELLERVRAQVAELREAPDVR
ncbi:MAG TPA: hypothetical protein PK640_02835 [Verrucomicrobiota bacterium]|nr:hypothetical protein [Verrucomicrobiota bacterium]